MPIHIHSTEQLAHELRSSLSRLLILIESGCEPKFAIDELAFKLFIDDAKMTLGRAEQVLGPEPETSVPEFKELLRRIEEATG